MATRLTPPAAMQIKKLHFSVKIVQNKKQTSFYVLKLNFLNDFRLSWILDEEWWLELIVPRGPAWETLGTLRC